jgi:hypothetical protein
VSFRTKLGAAAACAVLAIAAAQVGTTASAAKQRAAGCTPASNIEAIIDDSGSMSFTDSQTLRVRAMELLIDKPGNAKKTLGAVEFGSDADSLFTPRLIGGNAASMKSILNAKVMADNGTTNYNAAFALAKSENPNANARIFLTDGGHNAGAYQEGHRGGPPTYVIGLMIGAASTSTDAARLQQIADETGGRYYPQLDNSTLQATVNEIDALLNCQSVPMKVQDNLVRPNQSVSHSVQLANTTKAVEITSTWNQATSLVRVYKIWVTRGKHVVGKSVSVTVKTPVRKLKITRTTGSTYQVIRVTNLPRGKLHFKLKATKLGGPTKVVTQILQKH